MRINLFSKYIIRIPAFDYNFLETIYKEDSKVWLAKLKLNELFMHGLLIASPSLYYEFVNMELLEQNEKNEKIKLSVLKYITRASTRCIPFGLFSGLGIINEKEIKPINSSLVNVDKLTQYTRLDAKCSLQLFNYYNQHPEIVNHLHYYVNTTLYEFSNTYRYVDYINSTMFSNKLELQQINKETYLNKLFSACKKGSLKNSLVKLLVDDGFSEEDSIAYINELINNRILVSELEPSTIGKSVESVLYKTISQIAISNPQNEIIHKLSEELNELILSMRYIDDKSPCKSLSMSHQFIEKWNQISCFEDKISNPFYKELHVEFKNELTQNQKQLVSKSFQIFEYLNSFNKSQIKTKLSNFIDSFYTRYEEESIQLTLALDVETGIGYDTIMNKSGIDDHDIIRKFPHNYNRTYQNNQIELSVFDHYVLRKLELFHRKDIHEIEITDRDLESFKKFEVEKHVNNYCNAGSIRFNMYQKKDNHEDVLCMDSIIYSSPNKFIGRFTNSNKEINNLAKEIVTFEDSCYDENTICVEVDYQPNPSFGNVLLRTPLRDWKINYNGGNYSDTLKTIPITDLFIKVVNGKIILFSKKLNKRIIPFFSNAFNEEISVNLPVFKFLFDVSNQFDNIQSGYFDVQKFHHFYRHIPRFIYKNTILFKERWLIAYDDFMKQKDADYTLYYEKFIEYKCQINLPRYFIIIDRDMELLIDSSNIDSIKIFLLELKKKRKLYIQEHLLEHFNSIVKDKISSTKQYNNEFFYPFKNVDIKKNSVKIQLNDESKVIREFNPGSEWIYFKIYLGNIYADKLLIEFYTQVNKLIKANQIDNFHFIKYADPEFHIRFRLHLTSMKYYAIVIQCFYKILNKYVSKKLIKNIILDTYKRELERYHYSKIIVFENIFTQDSILALQLIKHVNKHDSAKNKWQYFIKIIDLYCSVIQFTEIEKMKYVENMKEKYALEFNSDKRTSMFISEKYNAYKDDLNNILDSNYEKDIHLIFAKFQKSLDVVMIDKSFEIKAEYLDSIIHMSIIRVLGPPNNRIYEFMLYSFYLKLLKTKFHTKAV